MVIQVHLLGSDKMSSYPLWDMNVNPLGFRGLAALSPRLIAGSEDDESRFFQISDEDVVRK